MSHAAIVSFAETWGGKRPIWYQKVAKPDKKKEAIVLLARNIPQTRVAEMIGINRRTLVRWLNEADFRKELNESRCNHLEDVLDKVVDNSATSAQDTEKTTKIDSLIAKAIAALDSILSCPESRNADRIRASELILKLVGSDRVQSFAGNFGGEGMKTETMTAEERSAEIERLLERRKLLNARIEAKRKEPMTELCKGEQ